MILKIFIQLHIIFLKFLPIIIFILLALHLLGFHLYHAFSSAFQTLGLNHRIWTPVVKIVALIYAIFITGRFCLYFNFLMAFQVNRKRKNYNHGKIKFKDTRWSSCTKVDKI